MIRKNSILFSLIFALFFISISYSNDIVYINSCGDYSNYVNTTFYLTTNLTSSSVCLYLNNLENSEINLNGNTITLDINIESDSLYAIHINNGKNITIKNGIINSTRGIGLYHYSYYGGGLLILENLDFYGKKGIVLNKKSVEDLFYYLDMNNTISNIELNPNYYDNTITSKIYYSNLNANYNIILNSGSAYYCGTYLCNTHYANSAVYIYYSDLNGIKTFNPSGSGYTSVYLYECNINSTYLTNPTSFQILYSNVNTTYICDSQNDFTLKTSNSNFKFHESNCKLTLDSTGSDFEFKSIKIKSISNFGNSNLRLIKESENGIVITDAANYLNSFIFLEIKNNTIFRHLYSNSTQISQLRLNMINDISNYKLMFEIYNFSNEYLNIPNEIPIGLNFNSIKNTSYVWYIKSNSYFRNPLKIFYSENELGFSDSDIKIYYYDIVDNMWEEVSSNTYKVNIYENYVEFNASNHYISQGEYYMIGGGQKNGIYSIYVYNPYDYEILNTNNVLFKFNVFANNISTAYCSICNISESYCTFPQQVNTNTISYLSSEIPQNQNNLFIRCNDALNNTIDSYTIPIFSYPILNEKLTIKYLDKDNRLIETKYYKGTKTEKIKLSYKFNSESFSTSQCVLMEKINDSYIEYNDYNLTLEMNKEGLLEIDLNDFDFGTHELRLGCFKSTENFDYYSIFYNLTDYLDFSDSVYIDVEPYLLYLIMPEANLSYSNTYPIYLYKPVEFRYVDFMNDYYPVYDCNKTKEINGQYYSYCSVKILNDIKSFNEYLNYLDKNVMQYVCEIYNWDMDCSNLNELRNYSDYYNILQDYIGYTKVNPTLIINKDFDFENNSVLIKFNYEEFSMNLILNEYIENYKLYGNEGIFPFYLTEYENYYSLYCSQNLNNGHIMSIEVYVNDEKINEYNFAYGFNIELTNQSLYKEIKEGILNDYKLTLNILNNDSFNSDLTCSIVSGSNNVYTFMLPQNATTQIVLNKEKIDKIINSSISYLGNYNYKLKMVCVKDYYEFDKEFDVNLKDIMIYKNQKQFKELFGFINKDNITLFVILMGLMIISAVAMKIGITAALIGSLLYLTGLFVFNYISFFMYIISIIMIGFLIYRGVRNE